MLVELKNGETLNGHLVLCDTWMNLTLKEVVQTSPVSVCVVVLRLLGAMRWAFAPQRAQAVSRVFCCRFWD